MIYSYSSGYGDYKAKWATLGAQLFATSQVLLFLLLHSHAEINYRGKEQGTSWMCTFFVTAEEWCLLPFLQFCKKMRLIGSFSARCNRTAKFLLCEHCHCTAYDACYISRLMKFPLGSQFYVSISSMSLLSVVYLCILLAFFFSCLCFSNTNMSTNLYDDSDI